MSAQAKTKSAEKIDALMEKASAALEQGDYFASERFADDALRLAHRVGDYERMTRICLPLEEARRQKRLDAFDSGNVFIINANDRLHEAPHPGCYLVEPILVAADARDLRERADEVQIPVIIVTHEPETKSGDWPLVAIGPTTIRCRVAPAKKVTREWILAASEAIGDEAIETIEPDLSPEALVDELFDCLATIPDHDKLHQALMQACQQAHHAQAEAPSNSDAAAD